MSKRKSVEFAAGPRNVLPLRLHEDLAMSEPICRKAGDAVDRLTFDGYKLVWHGASGATFTAFSGPADESLSESVKDTGPTPQGLYAIDPAKIEELVPSDDWGAFRVKLEPYRATVQRMVNCFPEVRTGMYIHGGSVIGTHGCIEINDDNEEKIFFDKLKKYGVKIELEVKYVGSREGKYEEPNCPYP